MRAILFFTVSLILVSCVTEKSELCYEPDATDRPDGSHLVFNEDSGTCVRVDGTEKDASTDRTVIDDSVPECSDENACTDKRMARCNQGTCEKCTDSQHCKQFTDTPVCNSNGNCVECIGNNQCDDASASRCFAGKCNTCESDTDCTHITGKGICSPDGKCVECTAEKDTACTGVCVIEPITEEQEAFTCDNTLEPGKAGSCSPCVATKQCEGGRICAAMLKDEQELGNFCLWPRDQTGPGTPNGACSTLPPYSSEDTLSPVEGGPTQVVCVNWASTCQGVRDHARKECSSLDETGDSQCGSELADDAYCVYEDEATNRCTISCRNASDCPSMADCKTSAELGAGRSGLGETLLCAIK